MQPKKLINEPNQVVSESIRGLMKTYPGYYQKAEGFDVLYQSPKQNQVSLVSGGGSGHEPMLLGLIGENMLTGAAVGNVFTSPDPQTILTAIEAVESSAGVLSIVWNYAGDRMNFEMAQELAEMRGIKNAMVIVNDDIASASMGNRAERRGVAGMLFVAKIAGAAASLGYDLSKVKEITQAAVDNTRSMGIALTACSIPGKMENFTIEKDQYEYGMGIHGEPGIKTEDFEEVHKIVKKMMDDLVDDFGLEYLQQEDVAVLVNGMAATTSLELYLVVNEVTNYLSEKGIRIHDIEAGKYCTALEMAGISLTLMHMNEERRTLYDLPASTPFYSHNVGG